LDEFAIYHDILSPARGIVLRILLLNFRDLGHPEAGGAEVFTDEIGRRLVEYGNEVTLFHLRVQKRRK